MSRHGGHPGRRGPMMRHRGVFPSRTVIVEPSEPLGACCACCGNYCNDARCVQCGLSSHNVGDYSSASSSPPAAAGVSGKAQGAAAGVVLVALALLLSQQERLFS